MEILAGDTNCGGSDGAAFDDASPMTSSSPVRTTHLVSRDGLPSMAISISGGGTPGIEKPYPLCHLLLTGEGAHANTAQTAVPSLRASPSWAALEATLERLLGHGLADFLASHLGEHAAPNSPLVTTLVSLLNADRWRAAGHAPRLAIGHSIGEVAAAHVAGMLSVDEALTTAWALGLVGCQCAGAMIHVCLTRDALATWSDERLCIAAVNGVGALTGTAAPVLLSVTLCGPSDRAEAWMVSHLYSRKLKPQHPWHHPAYRGMVSDALESLPAGCTSVVSDTTMLSVAGAVRSVDAGYWREWLTTPVDFLGALERAAAVSLANSSCYTIETGAHDALTPTTTATLAANGVCVVGTAASMRRAQPNGFWEAQRSRLEAQLKASADGVSAAAVGDVLEDDSAAISADIPLFDAGINSHEAVRIVAQLREVSGLAISATLVLELPTPRAIAVHLAEASKTDRSATLEMVMAVVREGTRAGTCSAPVNLDGEAAHEAGRRFDLTPIQQSYILGRFHTEPPQPCQVYVEFDVRGFDLPRLWCAIEAAVDRHPMLRVDCDGEQQFYNDAFSFSITYARGVDLSRRRAECMDAFERQRDFWNVSVSDLGGDVARVHVLFDMLCVDATSMFTLASEVATEYSGIAVAPAPLRTFRSFCECRKHPTPAALRYWMPRLDTLPGPPELPRPTSRPTQREPLYERLSTTIDASSWRALRWCAEQVPATPTALLTAVLLEALSFHCNNSAFTITLTTSQRPVEYAGVVGDFTGAVLCAMTSPRGGSIEALIRSVNQDLFDAMLHESLSGPDLVRRLRDRQGNPRLTFPVVLTSLIDNAFSEHVAELIASRQVTPVCMRTSTPHVTLDVQLYEWEGALLVVADFDPFEQVAEVVEQLLQSYRGLLKQLASSWELSTASDERRSTTLRASELTHVRRPAAPRRQFTRSHLLHELVFEAAARAPSKVVIIDQDIRITFAELCQLARAGSAILQQLSAGQELPIAIVCEKGWEQVIAALSIVACGAPCARI